MFNTPWIFITFTANLVREFTFIHFSFTPKVEAIDYLFLQQFLQSVQKKIEAPL